MTPLQAEFRLHEVATIRRFLCTLGTMLLTGVLLSTGCSKAQPDTPPPSRTHPTLLLAQAQFDWQVNAAGKRTAVPGPAKLVLVQRTDKGWQEATIEDPDSNVFHKAMICDLDGKGPAIMTIGGTRAVLKIWRRKGNGWTDETLWQPTFGGKWDRLRDVEIGDVTGDGVPEIVVATHDQGVVGVLSRSGAQWTATELDREPRTFVHEIEIGDVDGDGLNEFFATRSEPNRATGVAQDGQVVMYKWNGTTFDRTIVDALEGTHAKEVLVADLDASGTPALFAVFEARTEMRNGAVRVVDPVCIKQYRFGPDGPSSAQVATLDDRQCRCLSPGDVDGDGRMDIVATGMNSGLWVLRQEQDETWRASLVDQNSSGYEHAAVAADLDGDGHLEIYVASDRQKELRRYLWQDGHFKKEVIRPLPEDVVTFNVTAGNL